MAGKKKKLDLRERVMGERKEPGGGLAEVPSPEKMVEHLNKGGKGESQEREREENFINGHMGTSD